MRRFPLRRLLGALVSLAIVAGAPGSHAYEAFAQSAAGRAAESGASARPLPVLGLPALNAPIPSLSPSSLSLSPVALAAPAAAPSAAASPVAALAAAAAAVAAPIAAAKAAPAASARAYAAAPLETSAKRGPPAASAPLALARALAAPAEAGRPDQGGALFDGASAKAAAAPAVASAGLGRSVKRGLAILALSIGLLGAGHQAAAQGVPAPQAPQQTQTQSQVQQAPAAADTVRAVLPRPVEATASVDRQGVTVGERVNVSITLRNASDKTVTLQNLRSSLQDAFPADLELQGKGAEAPLVLAPGESKTVVYEAIPFGSGTLTLDGGLAVVAVGETAAYPEGIEIVLPKTELKVATVLTPDWKQKGLKDIVGVKRAEGPDWMWLAAIPLGALLLAGAARLVAARRLYPKLDAERLSLVAATEAELARLRAESDALDASSFYARYQDLLTGFMVDFAGLPKAARDARTLARDLRKSFYDAGQVEVAARLAAQAEAARFSAGEADASERARMLDRLQALVESVAAKSGKAKEPSKPGLHAALALLPGAAGLAFGSPWVLLLFIPYIAWIVWSYRSAPKSPRFAVSSSAQTPAKRTLRERLGGLPKILRLAAVGLILVALARPMIGTQRAETFIPSTDTMVSIDLSGSMSGDKLQGVRDAVKGYVEEQRRGTENRVGMVTFSDQSYLDVKLTTDYDALISHLKELETTGSTAIGKSMLTAIAHFLELNALELDGKADPRAAEVQRLLRDNGLPAALAYAKQYPDLLKTILQPERAKIVVLFTDGDSNSGIDPQAAAEIAASLGVKIYGVGIAGPNESFNEATLRGVAEKTGAKFYRAGDAAAMRAVLLEIAALEKSPAKIVSSVSIKDYTSLLALLAFLLLGAELTLANTRLRTLYGLAFLIAFNGAPMTGVLPPAPPMQAVTVQAESPRLGASDSAASNRTAVAAVPAEVLEGNKLYNQGRYSEALKKYGEAVERHPDVPEIYFNMADAYLRLGENAKAEAAWAKYLSLTPDARKQSQTLFNLGNSALAAKDAEKAIELYKEALRRDPGNMDAKWNLEALKQQQKEQQDQQKDSKDSKKGKPGKQKGKQDGKDGKEGKPSTDGKPGDGKPGDGKPGDGKPGDGKPGDGKAPAKPADPKDGAAKLGDELGKQEGGEKGEALKGMTRKGSGVWGMAALPLAFAGQGLVFSSSAFLWVVGLGLPVAILLAAYGIKKKLDAAKRLSPGTAPKSFGSWWGARRFLGKSALALAALGLIGLAAGDPRGGMVDERVNFGGKDIVVTVDGSHSMVYAEDGRMARTQKELNEFITRLQGTDRVGLVVFAGKSRTASPISIDYGNFEFKINRLDVEARGIGEGSNLAEAIKYSASHFETAKKLGDRQRILIIISDGDVPDSEIAAAIAAASEHGVTVYAIGVGDPAGTKIKMPTADGAGTEYLIDAKTGSPAITRLNEAPLRQLAERTGGAYFRSGGKSSIDDILREVSRLEKGQKGDTIKSPRPVGVYLLWPALLMLLLDLVLPGRSLLKKGAPEAKDKKKGPGGAAMLGAALIPLGAWPQILPFALLATVVAAYLAADSWSGGKITRAVREWRQSRMRFVEKGVLADLVHLYDLREADERRLSSFIKGWQDAKEPLKESMIGLASTDEALWREKLTAMYLSGAAPETLEKVLTALRKTSRARLEPLAPVTARMAARKADISWMAHTDAEVRLAALAAVAANQPVAFEVPQRPLPSNLFARIRRGATVGMLAVMIALTGVSTVGTMNFRVEQRAAAEIAMKLFYAEDLFVFSDRYVDSRITEEVIPALKRWHESPRTAGADFERALSILRESPDPKADNLLVTIFRHSGVLPLTSKAEGTLLKALIERESDLLWGSMDQLITQSRTDEAAAQMLVKLVMLGVETGNEKAIAQLFRVLKSPNEEVRGRAAAMLYGHLSSGGGAKFYEKLAPVQAKHAADPMLQLWTANFALRRLTEPGAGDADLAKAKAFLDKTVVNARALDAARVELFKQTPPDQEVQAPPSIVTALLGMADGMQGEGGAPAPLAAAARYLVNKTTTDLIKDAEKALPGLHERLIKDGVVLPDTQSSYGGGYDGYDDYDNFGHGHYRGGGGTSTTQNYREVYKLGHLRAFAAALEELGGPVMKAPTKENFAARELLDRAAAQLEPLASAGQKAGMMEGGSAAEAAAEALLPVLREGDTAFTSHSFLRALRGAGLAPAAGDLSSQLAYPEALDAAKLAELRGLLLNIARSGSGWDSDGKARPLTWSEKLYLAGALEAVNAAQLKSFPGSAAAATDDESLALARLSRAVKARAGDAAFALEAEKLMIARLAKGPLDVGDASALLTELLAAVNGTPHEAAAVKALENALTTANGAALAPAARARAAAGLVKLAERAESAYPSLKEELVLSGLREGDYSWRSDLKLRHYRVLAAAIDAAAAKAQNGGKALNAEQLASRDAAKASLPRLEALAAAAGAPAGDAAAEILADRANAILLKGHRVFTATDFNDALRALKLMPGKGNGFADYRQSYSPADLDALRVFLKTIAASGKGLGSSASRDLLWTERVYLVQALDAMDALIRGAAPAPAAGTLLETVRRPGEEALAVTRLALLLDARPGDAAFALQAQEALLQIAALRVSDAADAAEVLTRAHAALAGSASEAKALSALEAALKAPHGAALKEAALKQAAVDAQSIAEQAEKAFDGFAAETAMSGLRDSETSWRAELKLRHLRSLRAAIEAKASIKKPTAGQSAAIERARRALPALEAVAAAAGMPAGDSAAEAAAETINPALRKGYQDFPGTIFNTKLQEKGFMAKGAGNGVNDYQKAYTRQEIIAIRDWLKAVLASGDGWESDGTVRPLEDKETEALKIALAAAERALQGFNPGSGLHAFAPLMLASLSGFAVAPVLLLGLLGLGLAAYLAWRYLPSGSAGNAADRDSIPAAALARHRRVDLSARRMATAVNGGSFRSRFIGPGGTDFAEARPYQGEDMREIDWKTSAKKDELYAKKFELERDMPLMLVIDISRSGRFGTRGADKRAVIEDAAAMLALAASRSNVRVGAVIISDRVEKVIPPRGGARHAMSLIDAIMTAEPTGTATDLKPGLEAAAKLLGSRAMVAVLSDFIAPDFKDALGALASRHDVRAIRVTDPAELGPLPDVGLLPVVDAETGSTRMLDTSSRAGRAEAAAAVSRREAAVENAFTAARLKPISLSTEGDALDSLERAFHPKSKQPFTP